VWLVAVYFSGGYEKNAKPARIIRGLFFGTIVIAAIYGFLPETLRFSRAMILLGFVIAVSSLFVIRLVLHFIQQKNFRLGEMPEKKMIIIGNEEEANRVTVLLNQAKVKNDLVGFVSTRPLQDHSQQHLGDIQRLQEIVSIYKIDELIFCSRDIPSQQIIEWMTHLGGNLEYKIVPEDSMSIIGSNSKDAPGEFYTIDIKLSIDTSLSRRSKRLFDIAASLFLLVTLPLNVFIISHPIQLIQNIFSVLFGKKTWVGYGGNLAEQHQLPDIRKGVITTMDELNMSSINDAAIARINMMYAKDYSASLDAELFLKCYRKLGSEDR
jgi:hypothetical protein